MTAVFIGNVVIYNISATFYEEDRSEELSLIMRAMNNITASTEGCIRFLQRANERDYIQISRGAACNSAVGRQGGKQIVTYARGCLEELGQIQHELLHALGFYHEHTRRDRDKYVWINWENLKPSVLKDFRIPTDADDMGFQYDYESCTHYPMNAFPKKPDVPTMVAKKKGVHLGRRASMSRLDVLKLKFADVEYPPAEFPETTSK